MGRLIREMSAKKTEDYEYVKNLPEVGTPLLSLIEDIQTIKKEIEDKVAEAKEFVKWKKSEIKKLGKKIEADVKRSWSTEEVRKAKGLS